MPRPDPGRRGRRGPVPRPQPLRLDWDRADDASSGEHAATACPAPGTAGSTTSSIWSPWSSCATLRAGPTTGASSWREDSMEAMRCLRRRLSDVVSPARRRRHVPETGAGRPGRALGDDSEIQRGRPAPGHRLFGPATSRTRTLDATPAGARQEPRRARNSRHTATTRQRRQRGAPHRTNDVDADKRRRTLEGLPDPRPLTKFFIEGSHERAFQSAGCRNSSKSSAPTTR